MPPTTEKLFIYIAGRNVTNKIDALEGLTIVEERGKRISSANMPIRDGGDLGITAWQVVLIMSPDFSTTYMWGYITDVVQRKRGVVLDFDLIVSRAEVRLSKAIINGSFVGTDSEILVSILANMAPDLSGLFDFSSGVTAITTEDLELDFNNETGLDAIDRLADEVGANYSWTMDQSSRINQVYNPALNTNMDSFGATISASSLWWTTDGQGYADTVYQDEWNPANTVWDAAVGDNGGGIELTSQTFTITDGEIEAGFFRLGRATDAAAHTMFYERAEAGSGIELLLKWREQSTESFTIGLALITYDEVGALYYTQPVTGIPADTHNYGNQPNYDDATWRGYDLTDSSIFAESGTFEFQFFVSKGIDFFTPFVAAFDEFIVEFNQNPGVSDPIYFDGGSTDAQWMGTTNASPSLLLGNKHRLDWNKDPGDAPFDLDIGTTDYTGDLEIDWNSLDSINHMIVIGGFGFENAVWIFRANNIQTIFDLPERVFPADGDSVIVVAENTGTDGTPIWTNRTVQEAVGNIVGDGNDLLWSKEKFDLLWNSPPPALERAFRVTARTKNRIRATVIDSVDVDNTRVETADILYDDTITNDNEAHAAGYAALQQRASPAQATYTTYTPGLNVNDEQQIADSARGFDEAMIIQKIERSYVGGGFTKFRITAGQLSDDIADIAVRTRKLAETKPPIDATDEGLTMDTLLDQDNEALLDANNQPIFQVT